MWPAMTLYHISTVTVTVTMTARLINLFVPVHQYSECLYSTTAPQLGLHAFKSASTVLYSILILILILIFSEYLYCWPTPLRSRLERRSKNPDSVEKKKISNGVLKPGYSLCTESRLRGRVGSWSGRLYDFSFFLFWLVMYTRTGTRRSSVVR